jgi:hypothetical protein
MKRSTGWMLGLGGAAVATVGALVATTGTANAAAGPVPQGGVGGTDALPPVDAATGNAPGAGGGAAMWFPPPAAPLARPIGDIARMSPDAKRTLVGVMQAQLNYLGYGPLVVDGRDGSHTSTAANDFVANERPRYDAYVAAGQNLAHAILDAIDDKYRENTGTARAPDYVPAASAGLRASGMLAAHRMRDR